MKSDEKSCFPLWPFVLGVFQGHNGRATEAGGENENSGNAGEGEIHQALSVISVVRLRLSFIKACSVFLTSS